MTSAIMLAALLSCAFIPSGAAAGTYTVHSCKAPGGAEAGLDWERKTRWSSLSPYRIDNDCPNGALSFGLDPEQTHSANQYIQYRFRAAPDTEIEAYSLWRSAQFAPGYNLWFSVRTSSGDQIGDYVETCVDACNSLGNPFDPLGASNLVRGAGPGGVGRLLITLSCGLSDSSSSRCSATSPAATYQLHRADITLRDDHPPELEAPPQGPLLERERALIGPQQVWVSASDRGSGVREVLFEVDGEVAGRATIDDNEGNCRPPFDHAQPCKPTVAGVVSFDTTQIPDGPHRLRLLVTDATDTNAAAWGPFDIHTSNDSCSPNPRVEDRRISARFSGRKKRKRLLVRYGNRPRVRGKLATAEGEALAGAELCVVARNTAKGSSLKQLRTVSTNRKGRYDFRVPRGPSRRVFVVSRTPQGAAAASVRVRVRASARLRASRTKLRNGDRLVLRGKLRGEPVPRRGVLVELQARRGPRWQTFGTTRSNRRGKFAFPYRFTRTLGVQRYKLRALVPKQGTYPYASGATRAVKVKVVG